MDLSIKGNSLPESALPAFQSYNAMEATKERHLRYLKMLESKYQKYGNPSDIDNDFLILLLSDHSKMVSMFNSAMKALRDQDEEAHQELLNYLTHLNDQMQIQYS